MPLEKLESVILSCTLKLMKIKVPVVYFADIINKCELDEVIINFVDVILTDEKLINMFSDEVEAELS
jgi:uncharacterized Fe-S radical SAM superfamily protein PflX